ncbi:hypothetical protein [Roseibium polysiphoniae]|uniref:Uncharacterized protein n=1 Tax=Roseibium polysiphoniae TaxID=2571221 RepID=A0ABR9C8Y9_9HYPH|nr:hypothetical protein [Roseibium polysiphoniae]MBD8876355.1 hypothetical protein [Roseibium polysiphoniae]
MRDILRKQKCEIFVSGLRRPIYVPATLSTPARKAPYAGAVDQIIDAYNKTEGATYAEPNFTVSIDPQTNVEGASE